MEKAQPALIAIDIQEGFLNPYWGKRNNPHAEIRMNELFLYWRKKGWPVFHVQHLSVLSDSPLRPDVSGCAFMEFARPELGEAVFQKNVNSGFIGTRLETALKEQGVSEVLCMGFTTDHCVSTTTRMAANLGFNVLISAEVIHVNALASLHEEFARVMDQTDLLKHLDQRS